MSKYNGVGIGSDPEVFVTDPTGKVVPIIGLVGGSKEHPLPLGDGYAVQEDGVALEYNIPVCGTVADFTAAIEEGLRRSKAKLPAGYGTIIKPDHIFDRGQLTDPLAWVSGCDPDFSAWTMEKREGLNYNAAAVPLARYCGGHIHISYPNAKDMSPLTKTYLVRVMDMLLGVPSRWLEGDSIRSQQFGTFGIYRPKSYGLEYRTMSNVWMTIPVLLKWVAEMSLYIASQATIAKRVHDYVYSKDTNEIPAELRSLDYLTTGSLSTWRKHVGNLGLRITDDLYGLLIDKAAKAPKDLKAFDLENLKVSVANLQAGMIWNKPVEWMINDAGRMVPKPELDMAEPAPDAPLEMQEPEHEDDDFNLEQHFEDEDGENA